MNLDWLDAFLISGLFEVVMVIGLALLLHLELGLARIANFGVVGFWGIGMYVFGVLYVQVDWPFGEPWQFLVCAALGTLVAGLSGLLVGWLIADLDTDGVLVGTLGFAAAVLILATTQDDLTGGARGLGGLGFPYDIGTVKDNEFLWLVILTAVVAAILFVVWRIHRSPYGRLLVAMGGNEALARSLGKPTFRTKLWLFAVASAAMGFLGAMFGVMERTLQTSNLGVDVTLAAMVGLVLGGTARVWGAVIGVVLTVGLFDIVIQSYLPLPREWYTQAIPVLREAVFGATLIVVLLFRPLGVLGAMRRDRLMRQLHGR
ncbi:MAG TPA: branched-chain amino acid ABC transporter permease [Candidatus Sulfomarinibacteraceae bacterium]|nr:branched-chain amino acid ABC transporter permease [Candidatus Sulfomarinibacteraceae bacterium]